MKWMLWVLVGLGLLLGAAWCGTSGEAEWAAGLLGGAIVWLLITRVALRVAWVRWVFRVPSGPVRREPEEEGGGLRNRWIRR